MNQKNLLDEIKKSADNIEVPHCLTPEEIQKKLSSEKGKPEKHHFSSNLSKMCACAAIVVLMLGLWQVHHITMKNDSLAQSGSAASAPIMDYDADDLASIKPVQSYTALYDSLKKIEEKSTVSYGSDEIAMVEESTMESAASADRATTQNVASDTSVSTNPSADYSDTNLRTLGVDEGDIVKTDGTYIYIMTESAARIIQGDTLEEVSQIAPKNPGDTLIDMYLDQDTLHLISQKSESTLVGNGTTADSYRLDTTPSTAVATYDISDPTSPALSGEISQNGYYETSRKADGYLYLFTTYYPHIPEGPNDETDGIMPYVPYTNEEPVAAAKIFVPALADSTSYLVISSVSTSQPDVVTDSISIVSGTQLFYVSDKHIFIANTTYNTGNQMTELMSFAYNKGKLSASAGGSVEGYLDDSFTLDEYENHLRLVTTSWDANKNVDVNNLYVLDENLQIVGSIKDLAPNETIRSARFMGDEGYFVTFRQTDPLFSVDLSNPEEPQIIGTLKIPGFSEYLHPYGDGLLLGIGWDADENTGNTQGLKLSMFDISNPANVKEIHKMVIKDVIDCPAIYNYKAVMIDPEKNLFGLGYIVSEESTNWQSFGSYSLFTYDREKGFQSPFTRALQNTPDNYPNLETTRGLYIDDTFYLYCDNTLSSYQIDDGYKQTNQLSW